MTITYTLSETDYVTHQLFTASVSPAIQKKRRRTWLLSCVVFGILALLFYDSNSRFLAGLFLLYGLFTLIFFPLIARRQYIKQYQHFVKQTYYQIVNRTLQCTFTADSLVFADELCDSTIRYKALTAVQDIPGYYYLIFRNCQFMVLPKAQLSDEPAVQAALTAAAAQAGIAIQQYPNWKWR